MYVGKKIKALRTQLGLTQDGFAEKLGVSQAYYSDIERGKKKISGKLINKLYSDFNISKEYFEGIGSDEYNKKNRGKIEGVNEGVRQITSNTMTKNTALKLDLKEQLQKQIKDEVLKNIEKNILDLLGLSGIIDKHLLTDYYNPLSDLVWNENIDYKEFTKKYLALIEKFKPYAGAINDFADAVDKFYEQMYKAGDEFFIFSDNDWIANEMKDFDKKPEK